MMLKCSPGNEAEVIGLLLEEYRALQAEVIARQSGKYQFAGFAVAATAIAISVENTLGWKIILLIPLAFVMILLFLRHRRTSLSASKYLSQIEQRLNKFAADRYGTDADIFNWQSSQGWKNVSMWRR